MCIFACVVGAGAGASTASCSQGDAGIIATTPATDAELVHDSSDNGDRFAEASVPDGDAGTDGGLVARVSALTSTCKVVSTTQFSTRAGRPPTIDICQLEGGYFWTSSMNVDCDGLSTPECNADTDPTYQPTTSFLQSDGGPLVASLVSYVVIPLPSARFDYVEAGIAPGALVAVLYHGAIAFGVFGDEGPADLLGEASYAMAKQLGIDADPATGGVDNGVTYVVLTGSSAVVSPIEDPAVAAARGPALLEALFQKNR